VPQLQSQGSQLQGGAQPQGLASAAVQQKGPQHQQGTQELVPKPANGHAITPTGTGISIHDARLVGLPQAHAVMKGAADQFPLHLKVP